MAFSDWSTSPGGNNTTLGINVAEQCPPGNINDAIRKIQADMRSAIDTTWDDILSLTSLASIQSALGISEESSSASASAFDALTNEANKVPYMTGSDAWAKADFTSFGRSLVALGDLGALLTLLGASATFGANSVSVSIPIGTGTTLLIQGGTGSLGADTGGTITFPTAYSVAPVCVVDGGSSNASHEGDVHSSAAPSTTGIAIMNSNGSATCTYNWVSIGKA